MNSDRKKVQPNNIEEYKHNNSFLILPIIIDGNRQMFADFSRNYFDETMKYS